MVKAVEIEVDGEHNENLIFAPLQRSIRGKFDMLRVAEPMAKMKASEWPEPIPSQRLGIEPDGTGYLREPIHDEEHAPIREKIEKAGMSLEPALTEFGEVDATTWLHWIKLAVESGLAKVVSGKLPDKIDGKPRMNFLLNEPKPSTTDRLATAIEQQTAMLAKVLERLGDK